MKYEVTLKNGSKHIVEAWQMEVEGGVLILTNDKGETVAAFLDFLSCVALPD
jgi:hypothetical protein